jgi:hypothetical protein
MAGRNRTHLHDLLRRHDLQAADFREPASSSGAAAGTDKPE